MKKKLLIGGLLLGFLLCLSNGFAQGTDYNFDFLLGSWQRTNNQVDKLSYEYWSIDSAGSYLGLGYTLQASDTVFKEEMLIQWKDSAYYMIVSGVNDLPTPFKVISLTKNEFICENSENEFPKKILYRLDDKQLIAIISDDYNQVLFTFKAQ